MAGQNGTAKSNICRKLFQEEGGEDSDNHTTDRSLEEAQVRWNFDFRRGVPLEGDWVWEKVEEVHAENKETVVEASKENRNPNV